MRQDDDIKKLGEVLRTARLKKGLSARQLSEVTNLSRTTVSLLEMGTIEQPRIEKLTSLARALDLDPTDLHLLAGYRPSTRLPGLAVYLRTTTDLPDEAIEELRRYATYLNTKYGVVPHGPLDREDEAIDDGP